MIIDWELGLFLGGFYLFLFWVMPMCAIPSDAIARLRWPHILEEDLVPYWKAVRQVSLTFHVAALLGTALFYFLILPVLTVT